MFFELYKWYQSLKTSHIILLLTEWKLDIAVKNNRRNDIHAFFSKQHFYTQRQAEIDKKSGKC